MGAELHLLQKDRRQYLSNHLIGYLNINSVRNKIADLQIFIQNIPLDYFGLSETKLDENFPNAQFNLDGYEIRARRYRYKNGGGLIVFLRRGIICKRISDFELSFSECICSELTISKRRWLCFSRYRPPDPGNLSIFFEELSESLSKVILKYQNIIIMGDFNINLKIKGFGLNKLDQFCNSFNLKNSIKTETCFTKSHKSLIDLFLTNKPLSFQKTHVTETGLSDYHKLISTFFKSHFTRLRPKVITYRNYKKFDENVFLNDLQKLEIKLDEENSESSYSLISNKFPEVVNKHAPLKKKF